MDSDAQLTADNFTTCVIPDLRGIGLARLADRAPDADDTVSYVTERITRSMESPSRVQVLMFNSVA